MRAQRGRNGRSRSPPRMRIRDRDYSPRVRDLDRQYSPRPRDRQYSPRPRGRQYSPRIRDREYSPRIRDRAYSPRDSGYSPRIKDRGYSPRLRERGYSPRRQDVQERPLRSISTVTDGEPRNRDLAGRREYVRPLDRDRDGTLRKLPQFNEALSQEDSPSMRFQWRHLMAEPADSNIDARSPMKPVSDFGMGSSRMGTEKGYCGSGVSDVGQHGLFPEKPMPLEYDRNSSFNGFRSGVGFAKTSSQIGGSFSLPSENSSSHRKDEGLEFRDSHVHTEVPLTRDTYKVEERPLLYPRDTPHYSMPMSGSKPFPAASMSVFKDSFRRPYNDDLLPSSRFSRSSGMPTDFVGHDGYGQTYPCRATGNSELQHKDVLNFRQVDSNLAEGKGKDDVYPEVRRSERTDFHLRSDDYLDGMRSTREDYASHDSIRAGIVDPRIERTNVSESSQRENLRESRLWDQHHSYDGHLTSSHLGGSRLLHADKRDEEVLLRRCSYPEYGDCESLHQEDYGLDGDAGPWAYDERLKGSPMFDPGSYDINSSSHQKVAAGGLHMHKEQVPKRRGLMAHKLSKRKVENKLSSARRFAGKIHASRDTNEQWIDRNVGSLVLKKKSAFSRLKFKKTGRAFDDMTSPRISEPENQLSSRSLSVSTRGKIAGALKSTSRVTKRQLKPVPWVIPPQHSSMRKSELQKSHKSSMDNSGESPVHEASSPDFRESVAKLEPPEGSEDFKQLVHNAFLKFVKQLNENSAQRRRYTEKQRARILKCSICGSSEEFVDTQSLARHASASMTTGVKAQHLGFHRALCLLMGWNSAVASESSWVCEVLPDVEVLALKEDLIIWPPVIIFHNGSVDSSDPALRMIVNNEVLKDHLTDKGFGGGTIKVSRGKPANQSIMVVTFTGTFSGLQEAERIHKFYVESKHGRAEIDKLNSSSNDGKTQKMAGDKVEDVLYGYLGLAEDLDKLDIETKKRCVVKSKKDILAIADAPMRAE